MNSTIKILFLYLTIGMIFLTQLIPPLTANPVIWQKINDGKGFEQAISPEQYNFATMKEQNAVVDSYIYPNYLIFNESIKIGRDAKNSILWVSIRPEIRIVNQSTWPESFTNKSSWPRVIDGKKFWPTYDDSGKLYYISSRFKFALGLYFENAEPLYFMYYTNPDVCHPSKSTQWDRCIIDSHQIHKSFPLVPKSPFDEFLEGFKGRKNNLGILPLYDQINDSLDDIQFFCGGPNDGNSGCSTQPYQGLILRSLTYNDYDNFGLKYSVNEDPALLHISLYAARWPGISDNKGNWNPYDRYGTPIYFKDIYDNSGVSFKSLKTPYKSRPYYADYFKVGPENQGVLLDKYNFPEILLSEVIPMNQVQPAAEANFNFPEIHPPNTNIIDVTSLAVVTATVSSSAVLAAGIIAVYQQVQEQVQPNILKRRRRKSKYIDSELITQAIKQNKIK